MFTRHVPANVNVIDANAKKTSPFQLSNNKSPQSTNSLNEEHSQIMNRIRNEAIRMFKRKQLTSFNSSTQPQSSNISFLSKTQETPKSDFLKSVNNDVPLFTLSQVNAICEKMLKDKEDELREKYEQILNEKLNEQYDTFVKFTHDQIQKRFEASHFSYVS